MPRDLPGKVIFEPRHERGGGARRADILKSMPGGRKRKCKGPEVWHAQGIAMKALRSKEGEREWGREVRGPGGTEPCR